MSKTTITINGRLYDAITGMPVADAPVQNKAVAPPVHHAAPTHHHQAHPAKAFSDFARPARHQVKRTASEQPSSSVHQRPLKSQTLNRSTIKKPTVVPHVEPKASHQTGERSPLIKHFSKAQPNVHHAAQQIEQVEPAPPAAQNPQNMPAPDHLIPPQTSPLHSVLMQNAQNQVATSGYKSSKELKEHLIRERLAEVSTHNKQPKKQSLFARKPKLASVLASTLSLLILGGYFTYINLSNISMQVASTRAGVSAEFPNYKPSGYDVSGPITYAPGEVSINYKSNAGDAGFTLTQKVADWDSQAVLDNYVRKQSSTYLTFQDRGITVYTFNNKAAWSNGGMLYTIDGNASLSSEQVLRLATSI